MKFENVLSGIYHARLFEDIDREEFGRTGRIRLLNRQCPITHITKPKGARRRIYYAHEWRMGRPKGLRKTTHERAINALDKRIADESVQIMRIQLLNVLELRESGGFPLTLEEFVRMLESKDLVKKNCGVDMKQFREKGVIRFRCGTCPITAVSYAVHGKLLTANAWELGAEIIGFPRTIVSGVASAGDGWKQSPLYRRMLDALDISEDDRP
jgi:hypothetical protein